MTHVVSRAERILSSKFSRVRLWDLVLPKKNLGVGMKVRRTGWSQPGCYWEITSAQLTKPGGLVELRGNKYWKGTLVKEDGVIPGPEKDKWKLEEPEEAVPRLAKYMRDALVAKHLREAQSKFEADQDSEEQ